MLLLLTALVIGIISLWYTNRLVEKLSQEEKNKIELWAKALKHLSDVALDAGFATNRTLFFTADQGRIIRRAATGDGSRLMVSR